MRHPIDDFWSLPESDLLGLVGTSAQNGLTELSAKLKLKEFGKNTVAFSEQLSLLQLLHRQFSGPFMILLLAADGLSFFLGEYIDASIILGIILLSGFLGFWQELGARHILQELLKMVQVTVPVIRDGSSIDLKTEDIVPGDVVLLSAGCLIPADCRVLESNTLQLNEAILTGESFPVAKEPAVLDRELPLNERKNALYKGTHVAGGTGKAVVVHTGKHTEFGKIAGELREAKRETDFEKGIRHFGYLLMRVMVVFIFLIFAANIYFHKPFIDSLLFSLSLAIGITPFLLPAIISVNLARGARHMAARKVIVKRLVAIENLGSMNVFCSDKTGTLTSGEIHLDDYSDADGKRSIEVLEAAWLNAAFESGYRNPIDDAVRKAHQMDLHPFKKLDELPFDFIRKRLTVLLDQHGQATMVCKGAFGNILEICSRARVGQRQVPVKEVREAIIAQYETAAAQGYRVVAVAQKTVTTRQLAATDETDMTFLGMLLFQDPVKASVIDSIARLKKAGVALKVLTGDSLPVTAHLARELHLKNKKILTGKQLDSLPDEALLHRIDHVDLYAELTPLQKERVVRLLSRMGKVVGFLGDGVNDVSALHAADVGISVDNAVDIAKSAADFVLLEKDLGVLADGILEGRKIFLNTLKYIFMTSSANFGNIISMAFASLVLPFLPLLPKQLLATNFISDIPALNIPSDRVDEDWVQTPKSWNLVFIRKFMIRFGLLSSCFDLLTFSILIWWLHSSPVEFRSSWFLVTILTEFLVLWVLRTKHFFLKSKPGKALMAAVALATIFAFVLPHTFLGRALELQPIPLVHLGVLLLIVIAYAGANELMKAHFYRQVKL